MNKAELDILKCLAIHKITNQREISNLVEYSLGTVNRAVKWLKNNNYISEGYELTASAMNLIQKKAPKNAIILAAGFGTRMIPINFETPKALMEVQNEPLIERLINQLRSVGIQEIIIVVGFMKEKFEYLIDKYGVELIVNSEYSEKNNLYSLFLVADRISNTYVLPSDIWCKTNPFSRIEPYSWYMVSNAKDVHSNVAVNKKGELVKTGNRKPGNAMIGVTYLSGKESGIIVKNIKSLAANSRYNDSFWEEALYCKNRMYVLGNMVSANDVVEINTYEELRELDNESQNLQSDTIDLIAKIFGISPKEITNLTVLKKGMTNRSFRFFVGDDEFIMRIAGEGTDKLINRKQEAEVLETIRGSQLCDDPMYLDSNTGYKISRYIQNVRCCNPRNDQDLMKCMALLRRFHEMHFTVNHEFDLFSQIDFYESLWKSGKSHYSDYQLTKDNVLKLKNFIDNQPKDRCLTHIDAVPDNFLFSKNGDFEQLQLTDWEYSGMQDPHVDIAMFCIYSLYSKREVDHLIDIYFEGECPQNIRIKIYCYISVCGLLWSNWCEFKQELGIEFGEYSLRQYRFAKDYYKLAIEGIMNLKGE